MSASRRGFRRWRFPQEWGTTNLPFSTARADGFTGTTNKTYPFRAAGKLFFTENGGSFVCSASLIGKGLVVTAAHCVADFGKNTFHTNYPVRARLQEWVGVPTATGPPRPCMS